MSDWESREAYEHWRIGPAHQGRRTPLRPYQDRGRRPHYEVYDVLGEDVS